MVKDVSKPIINAESYMLKKGYQGQSFYSEKSDKSMTALANHYKRKIKTERIIGILGHKQNPSVVKLTKVTIL